MTAIQKQKYGGIKWLLASWIIFFIIGITVGGISMNALKSSKALPAVEQLTSEDDEQKPPYGTRDGRIFTGSGEMSMDWGGDELEFTPLDIPLDEYTQEFIYYLSYGYYIDFSFVMGLIQTESDFKADTISKTNDYGLMQINVCNHDWLEKRFGIDDLLDPEQNIRAGLYILRTLFEKYDDPTKVLMAYHMGEYGASRLWEQNVFETSYTRRVMKYAGTFKEDAISGT